MPCRASTNEDLSVPPIPDTTGSTQIPIKPQQKTDLTAKPQQAQPVAAKQESASQKPPDSKVLVAPAAKASAGESVKAPVVGPVPALPGVQAESALPKGGAAADQAAKISKVRESVRAIDWRAQQLIRDVPLKPDDTEIANPFPPKTRLEEVFQQDDESGGKLDEMASASSGIFTGKPSVSDIDLKQIRAQLEGRDGLKRYEKAGEAEGDASFGDASQPYDINLRLPPMD